MHTNDVGICDGLIGGLLSRLLIRVPQHFHAQRSQLSGSEPGICVCADLSGLEVSACFVEDQRELLCGDKLTTSQTSKLKQASLQVIMNRGQGRHQLQHVMLDDVPFC